jgi:hypothetical protein
MMSVAMPLTGPSSRTTLAVADRVGMFGSLLCALHCALMPLVFAALPALGLGALGDGDLDQMFTVFASVLGMTALGFGYRRHRGFQALALLLPGLALVWAGSFGPLHTHSLTHLLVMVPGGLLVTAAHFVNLRLSHAAVRAAAEPA